MIRSFDNLDAPFLHQIWQAHYGEMGLEPQVTRNHLERAILGRPWFDPQRLLVAVDETQTPIGWCHVGKDAESDGITQNRMLCLLAMPNADPSVFAQLLKTAEERFGPINRWGNAMDQRHGYAGLDPIGWTIGIRPDHTAVNVLIAANGFRVDQVFERHVLKLRTFKMPVKRQFLTWRRSTQVHSQWQLPTDPTIAVAMSHLDQTHWSIVTADGPLAELVTWTTDQEAAVMPPTRALLDLQATKATTDEAFQFSLARVATDLAEHGVQFLETVLMSHQDGYRATIDAMGFEPAGSGSTYLR